MIMNSIEQFGAKGIFIDLEAVLCALHNEFVIGCVIGTDAASAGLDIPHLFSIGSHPGDLIVQSVQRQDVGHGSLCLAFSLRSLRGRLSLEQALFGRFFLGGGLFLFALLVSLLSLYDLFDQGRDTRCNIIRDIDPVRDSDLFHGCTGLCLTFRQLVGIFSVAHRCGFCGEICINGRLYNISDFRVLIGNGEAPVILILDLFTDLGGL